MYSRSYKGFELWIDQNIGAARIFRTAQTFVAGENLRATEDIHPPLVRSNGGTFDLVLNFYEILRQSEKKCLKDVYIQFSVKICNCTCS